MGIKNLKQINDPTIVVEYTISLLRCFNLRVKYVIVEIFRTMYVCRPTERAVECLLYCFVLYALKINWLMKLLFNYVLE
jgi:hypothetical protein